jgi:hypothetical protein
MSALWPRATQICTGGEYQLIHTGNTFAFGQNGGIGSAIVIGCHLADQMFFGTINLIKRNQKPGRRDSPKRYQEHVLSDILQPSSPPFLSHVFFSFSYDIIIYQ